MRDINITGGNVTINIFDGCTIETIRINGGTHTHNYGQSPETLKVPCSQELGAMLTIYCPDAEGRCFRVGLQVRCGGDSEGRGRYLQLAGVNREKPRSGLTKPWGFMLEPRVDSPLKFFAGLSRIEACGYPHMHRGFTYAAGIGTDNTAMAAVSTLELFLAEYHFRVDNGDNTDYIVIIFMGR